MFSKHLRSIYLIFSLTLIGFLFLYPNSSQAEISFSEAQKRYSLYHDFSAEVENAFLKEFENGNNLIIDQIRNIWIFNGDYYEALSLSYYGASEGISSEEIFIILYAYNTIRGNDLAFFKDEKQNDQIKLFNAEHPYLFDVDFIEKKAKEVFEKNDEYASNAASILSMIFTNENRLPNYTSPNYENSLAQLVKYLKYAADNGNFESLHALSLILFMDWYHDYFIYFKESQESKEFYIRKNEWERYNLKAAESGILDAAILRTTLTQAKIIETNNYNNEVCRWAEIGSKRYTANDQGIIIDSNYTSEIWSDLGIEGNYLFSLAVCILIENEYAEGSFDDALFYLQMAKKKKNFNSSFILAQLYIGLDSHRDPNLATKELNDTLQNLNFYLNRYEDKPNPSKLDLPDTIKDIDWLKKNTEDISKDTDQFRGIAELYRLGALALIGCPNIYELTHWSFGDKKDYGLRYSGLDNYFNYKEGDNYKVIKNNNEDFNLALDILETLYNLGDFESALIIARLYRHDDRLKDKYLEKERYWLDKFIKKSSALLSSKITSVNLNEIISNNVVNLFEASVELGNTLREPIWQYRLDIQDLNKIEVESFESLKTASNLVKAIPENKMKELYNARLLSLISSAYTFGIGTNINYFKAYKAAKYASVFDVEYNDLIQRNNLSRLVDNVISISTSNGINKSELLNSLNPTKKIGLVIGVSNYLSKPIKNSINDAISVSSRLTQFGFDLHTLIDPTYEDFKDSLKIIRKKISDNKGDVDVVFYFSGHGLNYDNSSWLLPVDVVIENPSSIIEQGINLRQIIRTLNSQDKGTKIIILDACRNFMDIDNAQSLSNGLESEKAPNNMIIAYSTDPGNYSIDNIEGVNSFYTAEFLNQLNLKNTNLSTLFPSVRLSVLNKTGGKQTPWESSSLTKEYDFLSKDNSINYEDLF